MRKKKKAVAQSNINVCSLPSRTCADSQWEVLQKRKKKKKKESSGTCTRPRLYKSHVYTRAVSVHTCAQSAGNVSSVPPHPWINQTHSTAHKWRTPPIPEDKGNLVILVINEQAITTTLVQWSYWVVQTIQSWQCETRTDVCTEVKQDWLTQNASLHKHISCAQQKQHIVLLVK